MGSLYRPKQKRPDGTTYEAPTWWINYYRGDRAVRESTGTEKETVARRMESIRNCGASGMAAALPPCESRDTSAEMFPPAFHSAPAYAPRARGGLRRDSS